MTFNATFNNISVILWWSVLLVEETEVPGENHRPAVSHWQTHDCEDFFVSWPTGDEAESGLGDEGWVSECDQPWVTDNAYLFVLLHLLYVYELH